MTEFFDLRQDSNESRYKKLVCVRCNSINVVDLNAYDTFYDNSTNPPRLKADCPNCDVGRYKKISEMIDE